MKYLLSYLVIILLIQPLYSQKQIQHFVYFGRDRENIQTAQFLGTKNISGTQLKYAWKELEPIKDKYNFNIIQKDLDFLTSKQKKLFIQIQDVSFDSTIINVPKYLLEEPVYNGGMDYQYNFEDEEEKIYQKEGLVARRWDKNVAFRFHKLLRELGKQFDGKIEGINLPETAVEFGEKGNLHPKGFTFENYKTAIKKNMKVLKEAFPNSKTIIYANFMPGEWLPWNDKSYLRDIYSYSEKINVGVGGPDILVYKKGQMNNSYPFIIYRVPNLIAGMAVQWGNYEHINPKTGKRVTIKEIIDFSENYLKLDYIFWGTQEPYYSDKLIPYLNQ